MKTLKTNEVNIQTVDKSIGTIYVALDKHANVPVIYRRHYRCRHDLMVYLRYF